LESDHLENEVLLTPIYKTTRNDLLIPRYCLNYKGLPYQTIWVEYPDVASTLQSAGVPPTSRKPDGSPMYTLPAIIDPNTGTAMADSLLIAEYLDATYPDRPMLVPNGTQTLLQAFVMAVTNNISPMFRFSMLITCKEILSERSDVYMRESRNDLLQGASVEDIYPKGEEAKVEWKKLEDGMAGIGQWLGDRKFVMGDRISFADFILGGWLRTFKTIWGAESKQWKDIASWDGGRWGRFLDNLEVYSKDD